MRLLICGGRRFSDYDMLKRCLDELAASRSFTAVIHGGAWGADALASVWAISRGLPVEIYPANWRRYGPSAGPIRNREMLLKGRPGLVVAFPGGAGTAHMIRVAKEARIPVIEVPTR